MTDTYLTMMEESLDRKIGVLRAIEAQNEAQREIMKKEGEPDTDAFDATVAEKDRLVEEVLKLNDGFDSLYERVREELNDHKDLYGERIKRMQDKIGVITALSTSIEATEQRNKTLQFGHSRVAVVVHGNSLSLETADAAPHDSGNETLV